MSSLQDNGLRRTGHVAAKILSRWNARAGRKFQSDGRLFQDLAHEKLSAVVAAKVRRKKVRRKKSAPQGAL
jgi:hypothetical protein